MHTDTEQNHENFLEAYVNNVSPKLKAIDLFVKSAEDEMDVGEVARLLYITPNEVRQIMEQENVKALDRRSFFEIMKRGGSDICRLYKREVDCGSPYIYSIENISYIYGLKYETVNKACEELHIKEVTAYTLPLLFSQIFV